MTLNLDQDAGGYARVSQTRGRTGIGKGTNGYQARLLQQGVRELRLLTFNEWNKGTLWAELLRFHIDITSINSATVIR